MQKQTCKPSSLINQTIQSFSRFHQQITIIPSSFQSYQFSSLQNLRLPFATFLHQLYQQGTKTPFLNNIIQNHSKYSSSLLASCADISDIIDQASMFSLSHKNYASQSALLAFYLQLTSRQTVHLIVCDDSLLQVSYMIAGEGEEDKISFTKSMLRSEGVVLHNLRDWDLNGINFEASSIIILDIFGLIPIQYSPFLLSNFSSLNAVDKFFIYHSHLQSEEMQPFLQFLNANPFPLQVFNNHPLEHITNKDQQAIINKISDFLKVNATHPDKKDVIIFYPIQENINRFINKLNKRFFEGGFDSSISIISKPHQPKLQSKSTIFIVEETSQLLKWSYDYSNTVFVVDYGVQKHLTFDYDFCCYQQQICQVSSLEKAKRYSLVGTNQFGIFASISNSINRPHYIDNVSDLSIYILQMIHYKQTHHLSKQSKRVVKGVQLLQKLSIVIQQNEQLKIIDEQAIQYAKQGVSPLQYKFITLFNTKKESQKYMNLAIYMLVFLQLKGSLQKKKQHCNFSSRPAQLWKKINYIQFCMGIMAKCETKQIHLSTEGQGSLYRRTSSKLEDAESDPFGNIYQVIQGPNGQQREKFSIPSFLQTNSIDQSIFNEVRDQIDRYRQVFNINKVPIIFQGSDYEVVQREYINLLKGSLLFYLNQLNKGYQSGTIKLQQSIQINSESLRKSYSIKPSFISVLRFIIKQGKRQILTWEAIPQAVFQQVAGESPIIDKESAQEAEIQLHGISSLLFQKLWKNNGSSILEFEQQHACSVVPNSQMASIVIKCGKSKGETVRLQFKELLQKVKDTIFASNQLASHIGNAKFYVGAGGVVHQMTVGQYINKALLENIPSEISKNDLEQLFQQFVIIKEIQFLPQDNQQQSKSAFVYFNSQKDYHAFYQIFHLCQYQGHTLKVSPVKQSKNYHQWKQQFVEFKWYIWQTNSKALVRFQSEKAAKEAYQALTNQQIDGHKIQISIDGQKMFISNLSPITDQIFISQLLQIYGHIQEIQVLKTPLKQSQANNLALQNLIFKTIQNKHFKMSSTEKGKDGLRTCLVSIQRQQDSLRLSTSLHKTVGCVGKGRLYATGVYQRTISIGGTIENLVIQIVDEVLQELETFKFMRPNSITYKINNNYMILRSSNYDAINMAMTTISLRIKGQAIPLRSEQKNMVFNEVGFANLIYLEQKYNCKLILDAASESLSVICRQKIVESIKKEIGLLFSNNFFYKIYLHSRSYNYFKDNSKVLDEVKDKYKLKLLGLQVSQMSLILEGSIVNVQTAIIYLQYLIQTLSNPQQTVNTDICLICCSQPKRSYRLQYCSHRFCLSCLQAYILNALSDISQLPMKCPHCSELIIIQDLAIILNKIQMQKLQKFSIDKFVGQNTDKMAFCYTAGCREINIFDNFLWKCKKCGFEYCNSCKELSHEGYDCNEARDNRQGGNLLFLRYLHQNKVKICPNPKCNVPIIKIDGCDNVFCTRCQKTMRYDTAQLGFNFLNKKFEALKKS